MLPPGEYEFEAHASLTRANGSPAPGSELFGSVRVNIAGPMTGISISLGLAAKVSGRVVFAVFTEMNARFLGEETA